MRVVGALWASRLSDSPLKPCLNQTGTSCCILMPCLTLFSISESICQHTFAKNVSTFFFLRQVFEGNSYKRFSLESVWTEFNCREPLQHIWTRPPFLLWTVAEYVPSGLAARDAAAEWTWSG